ncbi:MAG TPA: CHAT domain-containing protein [Candidatus Acidoferrum sp.]
MDRGEFTAARAEVDAAFQRFRTRSPEWEWRFRILKARIIVSSAKGEDALSVLSPEPPASLASTDIPEQRKLYQGIAHRSAQQFIDAEHDFEAAQKLAEPLGPFYTCQFLIADAALWVDEKKYDRAEANYRDALALARHQSFPRFEATVLADWARLATAQRHYDESLERNLEASRLAKSLDLRGNTATILGNLGWGYSELGDFESSLDFFNQSAQASAASGLKDYSAYWFSGVASSYMALRKYGPAESLARSTLERAKELNDAETITLCLNTLAEIMLRTNRLTDAERFNQDALKMEESGRDKLVTLDSLTLAGRIATANSRYSDARAFFQRVLADSSVEPQLRWQAQAGIAQVLDRQADPVGAEKQYLEAIETIENARRSINHDELRLSFLSTGIEVYGDYIDFLIRHARTADALNQAELSRARTLAEGLSSNGPSAALHVAPRVQPQKLAQRMKATLLFYWVGQEHSYLWVITPAKTTCHTLPPATEIDPLASSYRDAVFGGGDPLDSTNAAGQKLYEMLIEPAKNQIPQGSRVILLPDGSIYALNFETLIVPGPKLHYWIEDATVTTASSLTLLAAATETRPSAKQKNIFLVGDTVSPNADFPALPQAGAEMQSIEKYFPEPRREVLSGRAATRTAYLSSKPEQYAYLHFVTHGTASRMRPLESAVVLSKENDEDSYKLYARDIVKRHLSAELVTISACNGAGTRAFSGEGLVGLSWAFLRAGAHNVIGALWEVSDSAAPQLMDVLYDDLSHGQDPATALRAAKLSLLHSGNVFRKPYYWAPFQLYAGS